MRLFLIVLFFVGMVTGCGAAAENISEEEVQNGIEQFAAEDTIDQVETGVMKDKQLEGMIGTDEGIKRVLVQVEHGEVDRVNVDLEIAANQQLPPEEIADTYAGVIHNKYPDHMIDIIVVQNGNILTHKEYKGSVSR